MADAGKPERLTLDDALKDFGFFYALFVFLVSGPSWLSLLQMVFIEHRLVDALQWIVDGYNQIVGVLGAVIEPLLQPAINWLNGAFDWRLVLMPHWRPLALLSLACPRFHGHLDKVFKWDREFRPWVRTGGRSAVSTSSRR
jgi:hypothetical protein